MGKKEHSMDMAFVLLVLAVFTVCALLLVLMGAGVYSRIGEKTNQMDGSTVLSYVTEKLRGCGSREAITLGENGELLLAEDTEAGDYVIWIYVEDGVLKEALLEKGREPLPHTGARIAELQSFRTEETEPGLLKISVTDDQGEKAVRYFRCPVL